MHISSFYISLAVFILCLITASCEESKCSITGPTKSGGRKTVDLSPLTKSSGSDAYYKADDVKYVPLPVV
jgi:hypothetical protein